jgi:hypothetical protein
VSSCVPLLVIIIGAIRVLTVAARNVRDGTLMKPKVISKDILFSQGSKLLLEIIHGEAALNGRRRG